VTALGAGRRVRAALDPVLVPLGFQAGQGGDDDGQVIWCVGHDELSVEHPGLPQAFQQATLGTCIDLVVDVRDDGTFASLHLEALRLSETLRHVGLEEDAAAVVAMCARPVDEGLTDLVGALTRLFARAA
jgi:hypothetical protein